MIPENWILDNIYEYAIDVKKGDRIAARDMYDDIVRYLRYYSKHMSDVPVHKSTPDYCLGEICFDSIERLSHFKIAYKGITSYLEEELPQAPDIPVGEIRFVTFDIIFCCFLYEDIRYARVHLNNTIRSPPTGEGFRVFTEPLDRWSRRVASEYWEKESDRDCRARNDQFDAGECLEDEMFDMYTGRIYNDGEGVFWKTSVKDTTEFIHGVRIRDAYSVAEENES